MLCLSYFFFVPTVVVVGLFIIDSVGVVASPWPFRNNTTSGIPTGARW